jgi:hypothetical protein
MPSLHFHRLSRILVLAPAPGSGRIFRCVAHCYFGFHVELITKSRYFGSSRKSLGLIFAALDPTGIKQNAKLLLEPFAAEQG